MHMHSRKPGALAPLLLPALLLAVLLAALPASPAAAADIDGLSTMLRDTQDDPEKICGTIAAIDKALEAEPDNERLLRMRISAWSGLSDPWSAASSMERLAALNPESPSIQLQRCIYHESMGAPEDETRQCYRRAADLCRSQGEDVISHEYLLAMLLGGTDRKMLAADITGSVGGTPLGDYLVKMVREFDRTKYVKRFDPAAVSHSCPRPER